MALCGLFTLGLELVGWVLFGFCICVVCSVLRGFCLLCLVWVFRFLLVLFASLFGLGGLNCEFWDVCCEIWGFSLCLLIKLGFAGFWVAGCGFVWLVDTCLFRILLEFG